MATQAINPQMKLDIPDRPLCPCVMDSDSTGENVGLCNAECYYVCERHDDPIEGCSRFCMKKLGCEHVPQYVSDEMLNTK